MEQAIVPPSQKYCWQQHSAKENLECYLNTLFWALDHTLREKDAGRQAELLLFTSPKKINLFSGKRNDGARWHFSIGGLDLAIESCGVKNWEADSHLYTMEKCQFHLQPFCFYIQTTRCKCKKARTQTGIHLPHHYIETFRIFCETAPHQRAAARKVLLRKIFIEVTDDSRSSETTSH